MDIAKIPLNSIKQQKCHRLIPSKFPPIDLFEDVADRDEFDALYAVQALTNPRIQDQVGNIHLVPEEERVFGEGTSFIMAPFTHVNPDGSRFSNGDFGIYYAAQAIDTAIAETRYHRSKFMRYTNQPPQEINMRHITAQFSAELLDVTHAEYSDNPLYDKESYDEGQRVGLKIKESSGDGVLYNSVRIKGINYALFKPNLISSSKQSAHYGYYWDGTSISKIYKKTEIHY